MTLTYARRLLGLSALTLAGALAACSGGTDSGNIATVDGQAITRDAYMKRVDASPAAKQALNALIQAKLIDEYAKDHHIDITDAEIDKELKDIEAKYPPGQLDQILKSQNLTTDDVKNIVREQLVLRKAIGSDVHVSDADVKAYFDKNKASFDQPEQVHARHILVADLKTAQDVEKQLKAGAKFDVLAKKYSTDPSSKDKGGDLGFFGRKQMVPSFEAAAFAQPLNVVGPPIKSPFGYHIIEVLEHKPAQKATLANSAATIRKQLEQQQIATQVPLFLQKLKSAAKITIYDDNLKDVGAATSGAPGAGGAP